MQPSAKLVKTFLKSYSISNTRFPQTRFYFVLDFTSRISSDELRQILEHGLVLSENVLDALARSATIRHENHNIAKSVNGKMIEADVNKMLKAFKETFFNYILLKPNEHCHIDYISECSQLKDKIDAKDLSLQYLNFVSPSSLDKSNTIRVENSFLTKHVLLAYRTEFLVIRALEKEITRPISAIRN